MPRETCKPRAAPAGCEGIRAKYGLSERHACRIVDQPRGTQRYTTIVRADEDALTRAIISLASQYGRYGYRRITSLLADAGWQVGCDRVQRIWRREGLKVPRKQKPRGRLWLNDGSCIRLRPQHRNHVWSYDFVEAQTHDGRKVRLMTLIDEFTRECLAIRVARRINSFGVIETMADVMLTQRRPGAHPVRQRRGDDRKGRAQLVRNARSKDALHRARQPLGEWLLRILQRQTARRMPQRGNLLQPEGSHCRHRAMAQALQHDPTALIAGLPAARTANIVTTMLHLDQSAADAIISVPLVQNIRQVTSPAIQSDIFWNLQRD